MDKSDRMMIIGLAVISPMLPAFFGFMSISSFLRGYWELAVISGFGTIGFSFLIIAAWIDIIGGNDNG